LNLAWLSVETAAAAAALGLVWSRRQRLVGRGGFVSQGAVLCVAAALAIVVVLGLIALIGEAVTR
jgi:hypothetical protein